MEATNIFKVTIQERVKPRTSITRSILLFANDLLDVDKLLHSYADEDNIHFDILDIRLLKSNSKNAMYNPIPF